MYEALFRKSQHDRAILDARSKDREDYRVRRVIGQKKAMIESHEKNEHFKELFMGLKRKILPILEDHESDRKKIKTAMLESFEKMDKCFNTPLISTDELFTASSK